MKLLTMFMTVAFIATVGYFIFMSDTHQGANRNNQPLLVETIRVKKLEIHDEIEALGTAFANEAVNITANTTDKISQIQFDDGQIVKQGDTLALLFQEEEQAQKKAEIAQLEEHKRELKRLEDLLKRNATAKNEYDQRKTLLTISQSKLEEIQARIDDKTIRAPFDGVLGLRKISVGSLVEPGDVITTLDDISKIKLDFSIPSTYLDVVQTGLIILAKSESLSENFEGKITTIASRVDPSTRSVEIRAILQNPKGFIKPGMLLSVKLLRNKRLSIVIPEESILQVQDKHYVYKVKNEQVVKQEVSKGKRATGWIEILDGLATDDVVITRGQIQVRPGDSVQYKTLQYDLTGVQPQ